MGTRESKAAGKIREIITAPSIQLDGFVTVDLLDERGKVVNRVEGTNYVNTVLWERWAKYAQRSKFMYQNQATINTKDSYNRDTRVAPALFDETLVCWNDTTAENSADKFCFGEPIAWAHKFGQGALMTRQGLSNPLLHEISESAIKWGFEWPTSNGNGTFQSVGWRRIGWRATSGDPILTDMPNFSSRYLSGYATNALLTGNTNTDAMNGNTIKTSPYYYNSADSSVYVVGRNGGNNRAYRVPVSFTSGSFTCGTVVDLAADAVFAAGALCGDNVTAATTRNICGMTRLGASGDWIGVGTTGTTTARRPWVRRVTPAGSVSYTNVNGGTFAAESWLNDITWDGSNLYAVGGLVNTNRMYVIDPATGGITSTITLSGFPSMYSAAITASIAGTSFVSIQWDSVNSWFWIESDVNNVGYTFNVNASGVWQGVMLNHSLPPALTLAAPTNPVSFSIYGSSGPNISSDVELFSLGMGNTAWGTTAPYFSTVSTDNDALPAVTNPQAGKLLNMNGQIWRQTGTNAAGANVVQQMGWHAFTDNFNFFSRSLLGAPVVKTSSNAMRITYEMVFS